MGLAFSRLGSTLPEKQQSAAGEVVTTIPTISRVNAEPVEREQHSEAPFRFDGPHIPKLDSSGGGPPKEQSSFNSTFSFVDNRQVRGGVSEGRKHREQDNVGGRQRAKQSEEQQADRNLFGFSPSQNESNEFEGHQMPTLGETPNNLRDTDVYRYLQGMTATDIARAIKKQMGEKNLQWLISYPIGFNVLRKMLCAHVLDIFPQAFWAEGEMDKKFLRKIEYLNNGDFGLGSISSKTVCADVSHQGRRSSCGLLAQYYNVCCAQARRQRHIVFDDALLRKIERDDVVGQKRHRTAASSGGGGDMTRGEKKREKHSE